MESVICALIKENPESWECICEEKNIKVKFADNLPYAIFNYQINADFNDPVVQEARGIIIDINNLEVVCWPFRKFGNYSEPYADEIDWSTARVQEKVDGSIVKYWYSEILDKWVWSTNSCIFADEALSASGRSFQKIIESTPEYMWIFTFYDRVNRNKRIYSLNRDYTYIFELIGPENQVVIKYPKQRLIHIGTRNNKTGEELNLNLGIVKPEEYPLQSLDDCKKAVLELNKNEFPDAEGFVVVDAQWHRVKVKSPEYLVWHHAVNNGNLNKETAYELWTSDDFNLELFNENVPEYQKDRMSYYSEQFMETKKAVFEFISYVRALSDQGKSRKEIALEIKNNPYSTYGFKSLDVPGDENKVFSVVPEKVFLKLVKDYE